MSQQRFPGIHAVLYALFDAEEQLDRAFGELADFECRFVVGHFGLYVHDQLRGWTPTRCFPLSPGT